MKIQDETTLHHAYQLGLRAIGQGFGVLDMAGVHQDALRTLLVPKGGSEAGAALLLAASRWPARRCSPAATPAGEAPPREPSRWRLFALGIQQLAF